MKSRPHRLAYRVPLFEVDMGQAVYHGRYFHIFELGREAFLRDLGYGYPQLVAQELHLAVVETHCRYRRPLGYDDQIEIRTDVTHLKSRGLTFRQQLWIVSSGALATEATLNTVCLSFAGKPAPLPPPLRALLDAWISLPDYHPERTA